MHHSHLKLTVLAEAFRFILVRFAALHQIKPHAPLLVKIPANFI